ncbi:peroxide stress protein YaaA [Polaromonas sp. A23]|uniref:peroxide stress protein YaaA n=1 Tax=Polaromonas sp. A23 TaxID=1944133 RepID=UPI000985A240|nr:peroxide stress protein YaaA [Polaromonas sp. A23]OOG42273.1 peroxide stress protein YaaA [Polaromonas sp. A23]
MLFLLSPAKSLDFETPPQVDTHTQPLFVKQSSQLIKVLKKKTPAQVSELMSLSDTLAGLNVARYQAWSPKFTEKNARQAVLAFNGDVYGGLDAKSLKPKELDWAQDHVCILSGLHGVLRPLDLMQPYRLEMGTRLGTAQGSNLYQFWGAQIANYLNERAAADTSPVIVNLASEEYFKAVDRKALKARVVSCAFEEFKGGKYKIISFNAKRARGLMARYAIEKKLATVRKLQGFDAEGYRFDASVSEPDRLVFRRRLGD